MTWVVYCLVRDGGGCEIRTREGLPQHAFRQCCPAFITVRGLREHEHADAGERRRTGVNETAAGAGGLTPASPARELLLCLRRGELAR
jgi:hypothetical protein